MRNILKGERGFGPALKMALLFFFLVGVVRPANAEDTKTLWEAVRLGNAFAMMRHALAPGTGDPENFKLNDCRTQRNLSDQGRKQAEAIGERFRKNGIERAAVFSSAWCRCQDTADRLRLGPVRTFAPLNSFFGVPERRGPQTTALRDWLASYRIDQPLVLVTHQVNIGALTGTYTRSGEIVVARLGPDGKITVLGKL